MAGLIKESYPFWARINDLPEFYAAAKLLVGGQGHLSYDPAALGRVEQSFFPQMEQRIVPLYVAPPALAWLLPLSWMPANLAPIIWVWILALAGLSAMLFLPRIFKITLTQSIWLLAVVLIAGPTFEALRIGQLSTILLLSLVLSLFFLQRKRPLLSALCMSVLCLKPQELAPLLAFLAGAKRWQPLIYLLLILLVLFAMSWWLIGQAGYQQYGALLTWSVKHPQYMQPELCPTLRGQLLRFWPNWPTQVTSIALLVELCGLGLNYYVGRRLALDAAWLEKGIAVCMPLGLVTSLHCHDYDLLLLVPSLTVLSCGIFTGCISSRASRLCVLAMSAFLMPFYTIIHFQWLLNGEVINPLFWILLVLSGVLVYEVMRDSWSAMEMH